MARASNPAPWRRRAGTCGRPSGSPWARCRRFPSTVDTQDQQTHAPTHPNRYRRSPERAVMRPIYVPLRRYHPLPIPFLGLTLDRSLVSLRSTFSRSQSPFARAPVSGPCGLLGSQFHVPAYPSTPGQAKLGAAGAPESVFGRTFASMASATSRVGRGIQCARELSAQLRKRNETDGLFSCAAMRRGTATPCAVQRDSFRIRDSD